MIEHFTLDYLPTGAAKDANAPYNEELNEEIDILVSITYSKSTSVSVPKGLPDAELKNFVREAIFLPHEAIDRGNKWAIDEFEVIRE